MEISLTTVGQTAGLHPVLPVLSVPPVLPVLPGPTRREVTLTECHHSWTSVSPLVSPLQEADEHRLHGHEPLPHAADPEPALLPPGEGAPGADGAGGHQADLPAGEREQPGRTQLCQRRRGRQLSAVCFRWKGRFFSFGSRTLSPISSSNCRLSGLYWPARLLISIPATFRVLIGSSVVSSSVRQSSRGAKLHLCCPERLPLYLSISISTSSVLFVSLLSVFFHKHVSEHDSLCVHPHSNHLCWNWNSSVFVALMHLALLPLLLSRLFQKSFSLLFTWKRHWSQFSTDTTVALKVWFLNTFKTPLSLFLLEKRKKEFDCRQISEGRALIFMGIFTVSSNCFVLFSSLTFLLSQSRFNTFVRKFLPADKNVFTILLHQVAACSSVFALPSFTRYTAFRSLSHSLLETCCHFGRVTFICNVFRGILSRLFNNPPTSLTSTYSYIQIIKYRMSTFYYYSLS